MCSSLQGSERKTQLTHMKFKQCSLIVFLCVPGEQEVMSVHWSSVATASMNNCFTAGLVQGNSAPQGNLGQKKYIVGQKSNEINIVSPFYLLLLTLNEISSRTEFTFVYFIPVITTPL